ncbi:stage III sporulation AC/AD family protein [Mordavella massiliensis]|uniref:Stage III sporulation protein AD n=2 Tax=Clostridia TaxID=186801 RepID=A0ABN6Z2Y0_9FIRM|nr:stage III sporulation AC/AD family protein [Claveliimonas bilis]MCQ5202488.1 stage III sporulation AC/AD family protein [Mordavella massiliensis]BDZ77440.1 stage III sporulation protein AD [Claveliimonas bilis]
MGMLQIGLLGVAGALLAIQFKGGKTEYGIYICAGISLIIFLGILSRLTVVLDIMEEIAGYIDLAPAYTGMLIKMLGITYVAEFSSAICRDAGYQTIAQQIEIFGKAVVLVLGLPVILALLEMIRDFLA